MGETSVPGSEIFDDWPRLERRLVVRKEWEEERAAGRRRSTCRSARTPSAYPLEYNTLRGCT